MGGSPYGYYLYTEASNGSTGSIATFYTPYVFVPRGTVCIQYSYHMYGAAMGKLYVYRRKSGSLPYTLTYASGNKGNIWKTESKSYYMYSSGSLRLEFKAYRGTSFTSDIAIDDIIIRKGS